MRLPWVRLLASAPGRCDSIPETLKRMQGPGAPGPETIKTGGFNTMNKLIIYHDSIGYCVTDCINYNSRIRNERRVTKCYDFDSPG